MAFVFDGTNRSFDGRLRDLEGEVFGPNGSAYQLVPRITDLGLNPKSAPFNAKGNGESDDTQALLDFFEEGAGQFLVIPIGIYIIDPGGLAALFQLADGTTIQGSGPGTIFRIKNDAGDYGAIFGQESSATKVRRIAFRDFTIDQNPTGNTIADIRANDAAKAQFGIFFDNFDGVTVDHVRFDPCCGVNSVSLNGGVAKGANGSVRKCYFRFVKGATGDPSGGYDNSAVYLNCKGHEAIGNVFEAELSAGAKGCIETHAGPSTISENRSQGYETGVNIVSQSAGDSPVLASNAINVTGNTFNDVRQGIRIWPITGTVLRGVSVGSNNIYVNNAARAVDPFCGIGVAFDTGGGLDGEIDGLTVQTNTIRMEAEERADLSASSAGILLYSRGSMRHVTVTGNSLISPPSQGIRVHSTLGEVSDLLVSQNPIVDPGNDSLADIRAGVILAGVVKGRVAGNPIAFTSDPAGAYGVNASALTAGSDVALGDNPVTSPVAAAHAGSQYASEELSVSLSPLPGGGASLDVNVARWRLFIHSVSHGDGYSITQPFNLTRNARFVIEQRNVTAGALGTTNWNSAFKMTGAWTNPAPGHRRLITFRVDSDGINCVEEWRSPADVAN